MGRDVGEPAAGEVGILGVVLLGLGLDVLVEILRHGVLLVPGLREVVAEAARARGPGNLGGVALRAAHGCDVRARSGELGCELGRFLTVVGLAGCTDA